MAKQFKKVQRKVQKVNKKMAPVSKQATGTHRVVALPTGEFVATIGRRKTAVARVRLFMKSGDYVVNERPMVEYFSSVVKPETTFLEPFRVTNTLGQFAVSVKVSGSGVAAQLDAAVLGIARALVQVDPTYKKSLRDAGLVTRDSRMKESRKPNTGGKARRKRQSPKR